MERYIAFLRGINVGGKNIIPMPELKELFELNGFSDVTTYINSGNIIFSSDIPDEQMLNNHCLTLIESKFRLKIPVAIVSVNDLSAALNHAPSWWGQDAESKHNAIFVISPITVDDVFKEVGAVKPEFEKVDYYGKIIFWSAPIVTFSKTRWSKVVGSSVYESITIRNANTVKKLLQLAET